MSPSLDQIAQAVVERIQGNLERIMAQSNRKPYPLHRRSPRVYTKKLKQSSRTVPGVTLPTGPMPEEPWYDPDEDEAVVPLIGEAFLAYAEEHSYRGKMTRYQSERAIASFLTGANLHEHEPIWCITRDACKRWRDALISGKATTPPARNKRVASAITLDKRLRMVCHFTKWCMDREYLRENPMAGLTLPKRLVSASKTRKAAFTDEELAKILPALLALPSHDLPRTEFKWVALALAFSGARCMEVLQLRHADVRSVDGVVCFDFNRGEGNSIKNEPSIRLVPMHSQLSELGFLDWVARPRKPKDPLARLFPLIHPKGSPLPSLWFTRLLRALQVKRPAVSLHSLRHTMTVKLERNRTHPSIMHRLLGHAVGADVEGRVYLSSLTYSPKELQEALEAVKFPTRT